MKIKIIILITIILTLFSASITRAQTLSKFEKWQQPSYFRGFCVSDWNNLKDLFVTRKDFDDLKATGANLAIIQSGGTLDETPPYGPNIWYSEPGYTVYWQDVLDTMVTFARNTGIDYIISIRTGPGRFDVAEESGPSTIWTNSYEQQLYGKMLKNIAKRYLPDKLFVGFDLTVEPNPCSDFAGESVSTMDSVLAARGIDVNKLYSLWIDSVRTVAPDLPLMVQGVHWSNPAYFSLIKKQSDHKVVYKVHCYNPHDYSHAEKAFSVTYPGSFWSISQQDDTFFNRSFFDETVFSSVKSLQQTYNVPILIGEFGLAHPQHGGEVYLTDIMNIALSQGWHFSLWNWNNTKEFNYPYFDESYGTHYMDSIQVYLTKAATRVDNFERQNYHVAQFKLMDNYPNPFNARTTIQYSLNRPGLVRLYIVDIMGRLVKILVDDNKPAGVYRVNWDGNDLKNQSVASGLYFYKIEAGDSYTKSNKMIYLK